jgi:hypothetical protein
MFKGGRKLALGYVFLGVGAGLVGMSLVLYKATPDNVPGIIGAVAAAIASLAGGMLTLMYGYKAEYEAKAKNGGNGA